jgi:hypothetical protein
VRTIIIYAGGFIRVGDRSICGQTRSVTQQELAGNVRCDGARAAGSKDRQLLHCERLAALADAVAVMKGLPPDIGLAL